MDTTTEITNTEDILDSLDIMARMDYLDSLYSARDEITNDEISERTQLRKLHDQGADYAEDWEYGTTLIRDSYFTEYAQEVADDIGAVDIHATWPMGYIDWDQAARALQQDYSGVDFDGVTYWVR